MTEVWEENFKFGGTMWGTEPAESAKVVANFFKEENIGNILLPGMGYGRNAKPFLENGIDVTGIEISETAIKLAREDGLDIPIHHGSVVDMPFDNKEYDGIFSYALLHLLSEHGRKKFIRDCYHQLKPGGYLVFTSISKESLMYGNGIKIDDNHFEMDEGLVLFFYEKEDIAKDFQDFSFVEITDFDEPHKSPVDGKPFRFHLIKCKK